MKYTFGKQIGDVASAMRLSASEKSRIRHALMARMHPEKIKNTAAAPKAIPSPIVLGESDFVPARTSFSNKITPKVAPHSAGYGWFSMLRFAPSTLALFLMVGVGVTYAAEGSLPGDALYPVKVNFTEEVRSAFTFSKESEASWKARRAERRLEEAEQLAAEGRLTPDTSAFLAGAIGRHTDDARVTLAKLEEGDDASGALAIGAKFETALAAHEAILSQIVFTGSGDGSEDVGQVVQTVRSKVGEMGTRVRDTAPKTATLMIADSSTTSTSTVSASTTTSGVSGAVASRLRATAETQIASMKKTFATLSATADDDAKARIEAEVSAVDQLFADGVAEMEAGNTDDAAHLFDEALSRAGKVELFMQAELRLNVNLFRGGRIFQDGGHTTTSVHTTSTVSATSSDDTPGDE